MSERKINLEEILKENLNLYIQYWLSKAEYRKEFIINAMKEAIKQALELAAENADLTYCSYEWEIPEGAISTGDNEYGHCYIDKQSIVNTINQIE